MRLLTKALFLHFLIIHTALLVSQTGQASEPIQFYTSPPSLDIDQRFLLETTITREAEDNPEGTPTTNKQRSNASNMMTEWLNITEGEVTWTISVPVSGEYTLVVQYSNDDTGAFDDISIRVNGTLKGTFESKDTGDSGRGWNIFEQSPEIDLGFLSEGEIELGLTLDTQDGFGIEFDLLTLTTESMVPPPATPLLTAPENNATGISVAPRLEWDAAEHATYYQVQVSTLPSFSILEFDEEPIENTYLDISGLLYNTTYYWRVRAIGAGGMSNWASRGFVTQPVAPGVPVLASPIDGATEVDTSLVLNWTASSNAATYRLELADNEAFNATIINEESITTNSLAVTGLAQGVTYYWRVSASNAGGTSAWSDVWHFTTMQLALSEGPTLLSPPNNAVDVSNEVQLSWDTVSDANSYRVQVSTYAAFDSLLVDHGGTTSTQLSVPFFVPGNTYYWRVQSISQTDTSAWSLPFSFSTISTTNQQITFEILKQKAFDRSQKPHIAPIIEGISQLDPPVTGGRGAEGLVFQEANSIRPFEIHPPADAYAVVRPRAALDKQSVRIWVDKENDRSYELRNYENSPPDYSSPEITPPINVGSLPPAGRIFSRLDVGLQTNNSFPILWTMGANGYTRFIGLTQGMTFGASHRIAAHNVFNDDEDFPYFTDLYFSVLHREQSQVLGLIDAEGFTGAVRMVLIPDTVSTMEVSAAFYARRKIQVINEPFTGPIAYSSMFWKDENDTPAIDNDEAHDTDFLTVGYDSNADSLADYIYERNIMNPLVQTDSAFPPDNKDDKLSYVGIENRDRNAMHYDAFASAEYHRRASYDIHIKNASKKLKFILIEDSTNSEFFDNIALVVALDEDWEKAQHIEDAFTIDYSTAAYYPNDQDQDGLSDQFEIINGLNKHSTDSDSNGVSDRAQLLALPTNLTIEEPEFQAIETAYELEPAHPNPSFHVSSFGLKVKEDQFLDVVLYNALGQRMKTIYSGFVHGHVTNRITIQSDNLPSGLYFFHVRGEFFTTTGKVTVRK